MSGAEPGRGGLDPAAVRADPLEQVLAWLADAEAAGVDEPNAMTLATASRDGRPSARTVLLKGVDERGFAFFTNYRSRKGRELAENPYAAIVLYWRPLGRQVCATGRVSRMPGAESDRYFGSRARASRLGALASPQSRAIPSRAALDEAVRTLASRYPGDSVPRPGHWGGMLLAPEEIELWQEGDSRLHDRLRYRRAHGGAWTIERLAP